ncbi:hypothetical protein G6F62_013759 [Rhizopus arrhizus]|nr:hypothetical protein G6F62_013759 [Rhizopus arrhizus]
MQDLANQLTRYYRDAGYPFARVYLPAQGLENGVLRLQVVEGRYGEVKTEGDAGLAARAQAYLSPLKSGDIIESASLERAAQQLREDAREQVTTVRDGRWARPLQSQVPLPVQLQLVDAQSMFNLRNLLAHGRPDPDARHAFIALRPCRANH